MHVSNSDFWVLAGILSAIGGLGVYEGYEVHPVFYSQSVLIFGFVGYFGYKTFHADLREKPSPLSLSERSNTKETDSPSLKGSS